MKFFTFGLADSFKPQDMGVTDVSPNVLGGKGAGLVWMAAQGVPVPPGFILPTTIWEEYDKKPKSVMKEIAKTLPTYLSQLKKHFGYLPLLSVRSGARVSCPGMMDTILNVGIDDATQEEWIARLGTECYANSLHRLVTMYGSVVKGLSRHELEPNLSQALQVYQRDTKEDFPDAFNQVLGAIEAVFKSWDNPRADVYRKLNSIPREWGTAVTVQAMVFGNLNEHSATGVLFTRNPDTGANWVTGEFLPNAQGEDIVAGTRTPLPLDGAENDMVGWNAALHIELVKTAKKLEALKADVQDIEFTIQDGTLYLLQTRNAKRSAAAAIRIALDLAKEGMITPAEAVKRVTPKQFDQAQQSTIPTTFTKKEAFKGTGACSGVVTGKPVFSKEDAINCTGACILITQETTPDDIAGMYQAKGIITMVGGMTSHAAVVARSMDRPCIVGVNQSLEVFKEAEIVSMDGATGRIWMEEIPILAGEANGLIGEFSTFLMDHLGAVPVLSSTPKKPLTEAMLYLGGSILHAQKASTTILETLKMVNKLYLDLQPKTEAEASFLSLAEFQMPQAIINILEDYFKVYPDGKDKLTVIGDVTTTFKQVGVASDLRSIVLADQELLIAGLDESDPAIKKVLGWKKGENLTMISAGEYVPGMKSLVSVPQALHVVAKGV